MSQSFLFFIIFLFTILITRVSLYFKPIPSLTINGFRLHHYMYGIVLVVIGILVTNLWCFAIGLGLFIDEVPYLLIGGKTHKDNYSTKSLIGLVVLIMGVFILKHQLYSLYLGMAGV